MKRFRIQIPASLYLTVTLDDKATDKEAIEEARRLVQEYNDGDNYEPVDELRFGQEAEAVFHLGYTEEDMAGITVEDVESVRTKEV